jgi:hypothetical protein
MAWNRCEAFHLHKLTIFSRRVSFYLTSTRALLFRIAWTMSLENPNNTAIGEYLLPIPDEFRQAAAEMATRYSPSLVRRLLKLDPWRLKKPETKRSDHVHRKPQTAFFTLPPDIALPEPRPVATSLAAGCRLLVERPDGARLALTLPSLDLASITQLCADFLRD